MHVDDADALLVYLPPPYPWRLPGLLRFITLTLLMDRVY